MLFFLNFAISTPLYTTSTLLGLMLNKRIADSFTHLDIASLASECFI